MAQGNYDHPSYLTRQQIYVGQVTGLSGTGSGCYFSPPGANLRVRKVCGVVATAGTGSAGTNALGIYFGTASVGSLAMGTTAVGSIVSSGDLNAVLYTGTAFQITKSSADATGVTNIIVECNIDPAASWT